MEKRMGGVDKTSALAAAMKQIEKTFGKGAIFKLGDNSSIMEMKVVPTGILPLDIALGVGGLPRGRIIEVYGPESSGKTTVTLHMIAALQREGGTAAFIDAEHALDPVYAKNLGVDVDSLVVAQPDSGEQGLEIVDTLIRSVAVDMVVVDSVAALVPQSEIDGDMGDSHVGLHARMMSQAMRKLAGSISKNETIVVFINQIREKVGVMFGNPETTTGGRALKFYSTIRLEVRKGEAIKGDQSNIVGNRTKIKVAKNKVAPPFKTAEFDLMYGTGYSREGSLLDLGVANDIIAKSGAYYSYNDTRIGQGRENAKAFLKDHPDVTDEIEEKIRNIVLTKNPPVNSPQPIDDPAADEIDEPFDDEN